MIEIDGKTVDLTKPETWGASIQIKPNGFIEQRKDGVTTRVENPQLQADVAALQAPQGTP
jgi:hypothetical protein